MKQEPAFSPHWEAATGPSLTSPPPQHLHPTPPHPTQRHVTAWWQTESTPREKKKKEEKNNQRAQDKEKPQPLIFCPYFNYASGL